MNWSRNTSPSWKPTSAHQLIRPSSRRSPAPTITEQPRKQAMDDLKSIIGKVATGATLSRDEAASAFDSMMSGEATPSQMGGLLMALRVRAETADQITAPLTPMRPKI